MIKSMLLYRVNHTAHIALLHNFNLLNSVLADKPDHLPEKSQWQSVGFSPWNPDINEELVWSAPGDVHLLSFMIHERALTAATIKEHVMERGKVLAEREGRQLYRKEYAQIKDEVIAELLPKAFIKHKRVPILIIDDLLVIGATTAKVAELVLDTLRSVMGSLSVTPFATKTPPAEWLSNLLRRGNLGQLKRGDSLKLVNEAKDTVAFKGVDLGDDEPQTYLAMGEFKVKETSIWLANDMFCKVTDTLIFKGIKFAEDLITNHKRDADGDLAALIDGDILLVTDVVKRLVAEIIGKIGEDRPEIKRDDARLTHINGVSLEDLLDPATKLASLQDQFQAGGEPDELEDEDF